MIIATGVARDLAGPFVAACGLLAIAGAAKVARPAPARIAARAAGLPVPRAGIVAFGLVEIVAGGAGAVWGGRAAFGVAACYLVLSVVAVRLLVRAPSTPCACLGSTNAVVTPIHVVVDVVAAGIALTVAFAAGGAPFAVVTGSWLAGAAFAVLVACCVKLAMLALEVLPDLGAATKEGTS